MEASFKSRADPSQGGGAAGVHRQTLDGEHGSRTRPERVRGMKEEKKKRVEGIQKQKDEKNKKKKNDGKDEGGDGGGSEDKYDDDDGKEGWGRW